MFHARITGKGGDCVDRTILHCDLNSFFASVELLDRPDLRGRPVAVCGDPASRHGIILAKNEPAKACGVQTAETIWSARDKCPELVLLPAHHEKYGRYSRLVNDIYLRFTDLVEPFSIDESWLDVTGTLHLFGCGGKELADRIRDTVRGELGLTISVGVSFNKIFAKLGSDYKKPDATTVISRENFRQIVWPLPATALLGVGRAAREVLRRSGIETVGQLAECDEALLGRLLGKQGYQLYRYANGLEHSPVSPQVHTAPPKSVGNGTTFPRDLRTPEELRTAVALLSDSVAARLRKHGRKCTCVQVTLRSPTFEDVCRQKKLDAPTYLASELGAAALELIRSVRKNNSPVRAMTITAQSLVDESEAGEQLDLFQPGKCSGRRKKEALEKTMDNLRSRYGQDAISPASTFRKTFGHES